MFSDRHALCFQLAAGLRPAPYHDPVPPRPPYPVQRKASPLVGLAGNGKLFGCHRQGKDWNIGRLGPEAPGRDRPGRDPGWRGTWRPQAGADQRWSQLVSRLPLAQKQRLGGRALLRSFTTWTVHLNLSRFRRGGENVSTGLARPQIKPLPFACVPGRAWSGNALAQC